MGRDQNIKSNHSDSKRGLQFVAIIEYSKRLKLSIILHPKINWLKTLLKFLKLFWIIYAKHFKRPCV